MSFIKRAGIIFMLIAFTGCPNPGTGGGNKGDQVLKISVPALEENTVEFNLISIEISGDTLSEPLLFEAEAGETLQITSRDGFTEGNFSIRLTGLRVDEDSLEIVFSGEKDFILQPDFITEVSCVLPDSDPLNPGIPLTALIITVKNPENPQGQESLEVISEYISHDTRSWSDGDYFSNEIETEFFYNESGIWEKSISEVTHAVPYNDGIITVEKSRVVIDFSFDNQGRRTGFIKRRTELINDEELGEEIVGIGRISHDGNGCENGMVFHSLNSDDDGRYPETAEEAWDWDDYTLVDIDATADSSGQWISELSVYVDDDFSAWEITFYLDEKGVLQGYNHREYGYTAYEYQEGTLGLQKAVSYETIGGREYGYTDYIRNEDGFLVTINNYSTYTGTAELLYSNNFSHPIYSEDEEGYYILEAEDFEGEYKKYFLKSNHREVGTYMYYQYDYEGLTITDEIYYRQKFTTGEYVGNVINLPNSDALCHFFFN